MRRLRRHASLLVVALAAAGTAVAVAVERLAAGGPGPGRPLEGEARLVVAAGNIACDPAHESFGGGRGKGAECRALATSELVLALEPDAVLTLGDNQYEESTYGQYLKSFDASWGRFKSLIRPGIGSHEYDDPAAADYFRYFGAAAGEPGRGYYSFDLGRWHVVALNSSCDEVGGCGPGSPQERWLRADLAASSSACTLAFWHHPRWNTGHSGSNESTDAFWRALAEAGAELVLSAHGHDYERFAPQDAEGRRDEERGVRQFVVGTGGRSLISPTTSRT